MGDWLGRVGQVWDQLVFRMLMWSQRVSPIGSLHSGSLPRCFWGDSGMRAIDLDAGVQSAVLALGF